MGGSGEPRYRVAVPSLSVRSRPDPTAEVVNRLVQGELFLASSEVQAAQGLRYAKLADGRGFALVQGPEGGAVPVEALQSKRLRVATVLLNPSLADSGVEPGSDLRLALPLTGEPEEAWPWLADY